jgi:MFS family permease
MAGLALMIAASNLALLFLGCTIASVGGAISGAAYQAYLPDHVPPSQYGVASGYVGALTMIGTVASFGLAGALVSPTNAAPFYLATIVAIGAGALFTAVSIDDPLGTRATLRGSLSWRTLWLDPWRHPDFVLVFTTRAMMMLALYTLFTFVEYYMQDVVRVTQFVQGAAIVAGVATIAALVGGIFTGWLSDKTGRRPIVSGASVLMAAGLTALAFLHSLNIVLGVGVLFGLSLGAYSAVDWALAIDVLPDRAFAAKDLGLWGISSNLPQTLAPLVGGAMLLILAPFGAAVGFGALFLGAAICAASSGVLVWRLRTVR